MKKNRLIAGCACLIGIAVILQFINFPIPLMPSFIKFDFSDLPELIAGFAYGPTAGIIVAVLKNIIHMFISQSAFVGELSNALLGIVLVSVSANIYKYNKNKKTALIGSILGSIAMAIASLPFNYYLIYPLYTSVLNIPLDVILNMYQLILPSVTNLFQALLIFNVPFTLIKGLLVSAICMLVYKRISTLLK